jgi:hypothetical protein
MQRELHAYAMAEMRNRGIEESARIISARAARITGISRSSERFELEHLAAEIRALKGDPSACLSDWWADDVKPALTPTPPEPKE